jgi:glycyl-tRNA synthetase
MASEPEPSAAQRVRMEDLVSLCARRGFVFASSEIYGGINGFWDYGPLGVELKNNLKALWWQRVVRERDDVEGLDSAIIAHPRTWEASGHVEHFSDPLVDCRACKKRFRADQLDDAGPCPAREGSSQHDFTEVRRFNLMLRTFIGASEDAAATAWLRAETCQSIFTDFKRVRESARQKVPFGIAQIGKAFRNEINPRNFTFRSREFEQAELEFFVHPSEREKWFEYWLAERLRFHRELGFGEDRLRVRPHAQQELAHYAKAAADLEVLFPFGWRRSRASTTAATGT